MHGPLPSTTLTNALLVCSCCHSVLCDTNTHSLSLSILVHVQLSILSNLPLHSSLFLAIQQSYLLLPLHYPIVSDTVLPAHSLCPQYVHVFGLGLGLHSLCTANASHLYIKTSITVAFTVQPSVYLAYSPLSS